MISFFVSCQSSNVFLVSSESFFFGLLTTGNQYPTSDWVHQCPQNKPQSWHHQRRNPLQGKTQIVMVVHVVDGMFLHTVWTALTLLSAHGAHHSWHRGPLRTVEPLLLEGQVRTFPPAVCLKLAINIIYCHYRYYSSIVMSSPQNWSQSTHRLTASYY